MLSFEAERRLGDSFVPEAQARFFINFDEKDPAKSIQDDDFFNISLQYHF